MGTSGKYQLSLQQQFGATTAYMLAGSGVDNNSSQSQVTIPESYVSSLSYSSNQAIIGKPVTIGITSAEGQQSTIAAIVNGVQQKTLIGASSAYANTALANQLYSVQSTGLPAAISDSFSTVEATFPSNFTAAQISTIKSDLTAKGYSGQTIKDRA